LCSPESAGIVGDAAGGSALPALCIAPAAGFSASSALCCGAHPGVLVIMSNSAPVPKT